MTARCSSILTVAAIAAAALGAAVAAQAQPVTIPTGIGVKDLAGGGWAVGAFYQTDVKTGLAVTETKLQSDLKEAQEIKNSHKEGFEAMSEVNEAGKSLYEAAEALDKYKEMQEAYEHLTPEDGPFEPNYTPPGMPEVPTHCAGKASCDECFTKAYADLNAVRVRFEKLRVLYASTMTWVKSAMSFGDTAASAVGIGGLAWQTEKKKIQGSVANLDAAYDAKYAELLNTLQQDLKEIEVCEAREFNDPDWYNRFGYMFYTFMAAHYQRGT